MSSLPGETLITNGPAQAATVASATIAKALRDAIALRSTASIALSGGNTPRGAYVLLASESGIDWSKVDVLWVDERAVAPTDDRSNYRWAKATLLDALPAAASRAIRMEAERGDLEQAARDYESALQARVAPDEKGVPAFDVMVLGVGDDGHTASLFPGEPTVDLVDRWVAAVPAHAGLEARLTLTVPVIQHARQVLVLAVGANKRDALRRVSEERGDVHATPARILRDCLGKVSWIVDGEAVSALAPNGGPTGGQTP
jgi:6-phosphogluconolactonase